MMMMLGIAEGGYRRCRRDIWKTNSQHEGGRQVTVANPEPAG